LRSPLALAWRLHRGLLVSWTAGFAALGLIFGGVSQSITQLGGDSSNLTEIFSRLGGKSALINSYFAGIAGILGIIAAGYAIQATLRMREEEATGHAEVLLTDAVGRRRWAAGHLLFALLGPAVVLLVAGLLEAVTYGLINHDMGKVGAVLGSVLAQLPAVWVMAAIAVALVGLLPRFSAVSWGALGVSLLILLVGTTLQASQYVLDISPFTHIPHLPGGVAHPLPFIVLLAVALALTATGLTALRRRDIPA
jgi:ABC-2 type transport system permease protein